MSFRPDISIDWRVEPRLISVPAPSVEITVQDLFDTLRAHEDDAVNLVYPSIVRATGKERLTDVLSVGITCTLLDAKVVFTDHLSFTRIDIKGGNLLAIEAELDSAGDEVSTSPIESDKADFTQVVYDLSPTATSVRPTITRSYPIIQG